MLHDSILGWDRKSAPDSTGALAFYAFKKALGGDDGQSDRASARASPTSKSSKPCAADRGWLRTAFGEVAVPFGRYFRVGRRGGDRSWPVGGGSLQDVGMATPRAISFGATARRQAA